MVNKVKSTGIVAGWLATFPNLAQEETGGGCTALTHPLDDGGLLMLTNDAEIPTDQDEFVSCGRYDSDGEQVGEVILLPIRYVKAWLTKQLGFTSAPARAPAHDKPRWVNLPSVAATVKQTIANCEKLLGTDTDAAMFQRAALKSFALNFANRLEQDDMPSFEREQFLKECGL